MPTLSSLWQRTAAVVGLFAATLALTGCGGPNLIDRAQGSWGICGLLVIILAIIGIVEVINSNRDTGSKVLWVAILFFLPGLGVLLYYFFGRDK
ncbi:MAG: PLD nuclease N-terminal domain-containing protein [Bacteroidota bacterium]